MIKFDPPIELHLRVGFTWKIKSIQIAEDGDEVCYRSFHKKEQSPVYLIDWVGVPPNEIFKICGLCFENGTYYNKDEWLRWELMKGALRRQEAISSPESHENSRKRVE